MKAGLRGLCSPRPGATADDIRTAHSYFFGETAALQRIAKRICAECPVEAECLAGALERREPDGVWGGMTAKERAALLKRIKDQ